MNEDDFSLESIFNGWIIWREKLLWCTREISHNRGAENQIPLISGEIPEFSQVLMEFCE